MKQFNHRDTEEKHGAHREKKCRIERLSVLCAFFALFVVNSFCYEMPKLD